MEVRNKVRTQLELPRWEDELFIDNKGHVFICVWEYCAKKAQVWTRLPVWSFVLTLCGFVGTESS